MDTLRTDGTSALRLLDAGLPQWRTIRLTAAALALLGAGLLGAGCQHHLVSDAEIEAFCRQHGAQTAACEQIYTRQRDEAEALGCGAEYAVYFRCDESAAYSQTDPRCSGTADTFSPVDECGLRHDPHSMCIRAEQHASQCGYLHYYAPGFCDADLYKWCAGRCVLSADCKTLQSYERSPDAGAQELKACTEDCLLSVGEIRVLINPDYPFQ